MKDKWEALHDFWSSFGVPAYDTSDVPDDAVMPYITYTAQTAEFEKVLLMNASLWYRSTSWKEISNKVDEIAQALRGYKLEPLDDKQYLLLTQGVPFAQRMPDEDDSVRRVYINVMAEFFTFY